MFQQVRLVVGGNGQKESELLFSVRDTNVAQRWAGSLALANQHSKIREADRWYNFPGHPGSSETLLSEQLEDCIKAINGFFPGLISSKEEGERLQERINRIHLHFADTELDKSYINEQTELLWAQLNNLLHGYESLVRSRETEKSAGIPESNIVVTWHDHFPQELQLEDYQYFSVAKKFGTIYINYCQVGRHLYELFLARDDCAFDEHVRPLRRLSADSYIWLGSTTGPSSLARRQEAIRDWFQCNRERLNRLGFHWGDPTLAIGWVPVADLIGDYGELEKQRRLLSDFGKMSAVKALSLV